MSREELEEWIEALQGIMSQEDLMEEISVERYKNLDAEYREFMLRKIAGIGDKQTKSPEPMKSQRLFQE